MTIIVFFSYMMNFEELKQKARKVDRTIHTLETEIRQVARILYSPKEPAHVKLGIGFIKNYSNKLKKCCVSYTLTNLVLSNY